MYQKYALQSLQLVYYYYYNYYYYYYQEQKNLKEIKELEVKKLCETRNQSTIGINTMGNQLTQAINLQKSQSPAEKAQYQKNQFNKDLSYMSFLFARQVCWWFTPKNILLEKELIKKICSENLLFLKLFKCKLAHGSICYLIIIDGYVQNKGKDCIPAISKALKLFNPIVLIQGFKIQEILNFNLYGSFEYTFDDADLECMVCLNVKSLGNKQNCCGKPICQECRKSQKKNCFYCKQVLVLRDYLNQEEYEITRKMIKDQEDDIRENGVCQ